MFWCFILTAITLNYIRLFILYICMVVYFITVKILVMDFSRLIWFFTRGQLFLSKWQFMYSLYLLYKYILNSRTKCRGNLPNYNVVAFRIFRKSLEIEWREPIRMQPLSISPCTTLPLIYFFCQLPVTTSRTGATP